MSFRKRFHESNIQGLIVNTVHDSIVCDIQRDGLEGVSRLFHGVFTDLPTNFRRVFGVDFTDRKSVV